LQVSRARLNLAMDTVRLDEDEVDPTKSSYLNQPELVWSGLYQRASENDLPDSGYLPFGWKRVLKGEGKDAKWLYTADSTDSQPPSYHERPPSYGEAHTPPDIYSKKEFRNRNYIA
jgi:hypothetical protein